MGGICFRGVFHWRHTLVGAGQLLGAPLIPWVVCNLLRLGRSVDGLNAPPALGWLCGLVGIFGRWWLEVTCARGEATLLTCNGVERRIAVPLERQRVAALRQEVGYLIFGPDRLQDERSQFHDMLS